MISTASPRPRSARGLAAAILILAAAPSLLHASSGYQRVLFRARDRVLPALVHITPILEVYRAGRQEKMAVTGSGVIISADGYVITNNHVVENARRVTCTLSDRQEAEAEIVGSDPLSDIAVIKLDPSTVTGRLTPAKLGNSDALEVGEIVMAMGSPLGLARSVSMGVISSLNRYIPEGQLPSGEPTGRYNTWIQTDAAINPGNSGGPLVNLRGEVVGINARAIPIVGENLGFAIPINLAKEVIRQLIASGNISRAWIGVTWQELQPLASYLGVAPDHGAVVSSVVGGSPAAEAELQAGDVVMVFDNRPIVARYEEDLPSLQKLIADTPIGKTVDVIYLRDGHHALTQLTTRQQPKIEAKEVECREWGFTAQELTEETARAMKLEDHRGVLVSGVRDDSFAEDAGVRHGDIVRAIDEKPVEDLEGFRQSCKALTDARAEKILVQVRRGRVVNFHLMKPSYKKDVAGKPATATSRSEEGKP
jgi:serine protease Do